VIEPFIYVMPLP